MKGCEQMVLPMGANFAYEEDGIYFRVYHKNIKIKIYARLGNRTVIEFGDTPYIAAKGKEKVVEAIKNYRAHNRFGYFLIYYIGIDNIGKEDRKIIMETFKL